MMNEEDQSESKVPWTPQPGPSHEYKEGHDVDANILQTAMDTSVGSSNSEGKGNSRLSASPTSFLNYSEDDEEDDDDDLLRTAPEFLKSIKEITNQPSPDSSMDHMSVNSACNSPVSPVKPSVKPVPKSAFCLNNLVDEHAGKADHVKAYDKLKTEVKTDGSFVTTLTKEDEAIKDVELHKDHHYILKQMNHTEEEIQLERPGMQVFDLDQYGCLFDETLHPCQCGFNVTNNTSTIERRVQNATQDQFLMLVQSDILSMCFPNITCQSQLLRWLFYIMSVDDNYLLRKASYQTIVNIIHQQKVNNSQIWSPLFTEFVTVLFNLGASLRSLIPKELNMDLNEKDLREQLSNRPKTKQTALPSSIRQEDVKEKLKIVLQVLAVSLHQNKNQHCPKDLTAYLSVLSKIALDPLFSNYFAHRNICDCIEMVLQNYSDTDWEKEKIHICRMLMTTTTHHHDLSHMTKLLPEGNRGVYIQRRLSYLILSYILTDQAVSDTQLEELRIKDLYLFVPIMSSLLQEDLYKLSSVITLLDKCVVSNYSLTSTDRDELKKLIDLINKLRVKDNVTLTNRNKVKDMLVRLTCCWSLDLQTFRSKQTKIFQYANFESPVKMKIEQLGAQNGDVSDISESESTDNEDIELPSKIPKLDEPESVS